MRKVKKYVDESFVFWTSHPEEEINLHFNEWYSPPKCLLDIGVRICDIKKSETLYIYLPLNIKEEDIEDLYSRFDIEWVKDKISKNPKEANLNAENIVKNTACAIFNSNCEITDGADIAAADGKLSNGAVNNLIRIKHGLRVDYFIKLTNDIFKFEKIEDIDDSGKPVKGALLTINFKPFLDFVANEKVEDDYEKGVYVRFRVPHPPLEKDNLKKGVSCGTFVDAPSRNTLIQYMQRVNELRSLPLKLREEHGYKEKQYIGKVMSMLAASKKYEIDDGECYKIRQLEYGLHRLYIPAGFVENKDKDNINAYQWKAVNKNDKLRTNSFIFNIKIQRDESKFTDWLRYGAVGLVSGLVSVFLSLLITEVLLPLI